MSGRPKGLHNPHEYIYIGNIAINESKFFSRIIQQDNGCELWVGGKHRQGYGMFNVYNTALGKRQMQVTHRIAMMLELGRELTRDEFVIHEFCDNQLCCNTEHMIVGTSFDRNRVQYAKGRKPTGVKRGNAVRKQNRNYKYTEEQMRYIRDHSTEESAEKYGITRRAASYLKHRFNNGYKWLG